MKRLSVWALVVVVSLCAIALGSTPLLPGADQAPLLYVLAAFRPLWIASAAAVVLVVLLVLAASRRRLPALALVAVLVFLAAVGVPAFNRAKPVAATSLTAQGTLRVLSWNTNQQDVSRTAITALVERTHANIVVLPEYFATLAKGTLSTLISREHMSVLGLGGSSASTILISKSLGRYQLDNSHKPNWAGLYLVPQKPGSPRILVAHLQRPSTTSTVTWRQHLAWVRHQCQQGNIIAVGDFNATLANIGGDHVGNCTDAAATLGRTETGTWPTELPAWLGAGIDHAFIGAGWHAVSFNVLDGAHTDGSDHRPVFTVIARD